MLEIRPATFSQTPSYLAMRADELILLVQMRVLAYSDEGSRCDLLSLILSRGAPLHLPDCHRQWNIHV
jgi:hypothetical protein